MRGVSLGLFFLLAFGGWDWLRSEDPDIAAGNGAYSEGNFGEALELYERSTSNPTSKASVRFDVGAALYKLAGATTEEAKRNEYLERAESSFREATDTDDPLLKSGAYHNLGNSFFLRERWPQAADAYKKALRANQDNDDARYNLELALRKQKKNNKQKSSQQGQGQGKNKPKDPGNNKGQGQQQKPQGSNDPGGQNQDDPTAKDPGQKGQGQGQQKPDDQKNPDGTDKNQPTPGQGQKNQNDPKDPNNQGKPNPNPSDPQAGSGAPQNQPQKGQGQPKGSNSPSQKPGTDPSGSDPSAGDPNADRSGEPGDSESKSDRDRKLDSLENRSRDLRRRRLRRGGSSDRRGRFNNPKDW